MPSQTTNLISRTAEGHFDLVALAEGCGGASRDNRGIVTKNLGPLGASKSGSKVAKNEDRIGQLGSNDPGQWTMYNLLLEGKIDHKDRKKREEGKR